MFKLTALLLLIQLCFPNNIFSDKRYFTRDPFNPNPIDVINKTQTFSEKSFKVMGIIWDKELPSVVIQFPRFKKIFYIGDTVNSFKITAITKKHIEITTPKEKIMVKLGEEKIFE